MEQRKSKENINLNKFLWKVVAVKFFNVYAERKSNKWKQLTQIKDERRFFFKCLLLNISDEKIITECLIIFHNVNVYWNIWETA